MRLGRIDVTVPLKGKTRPWFEGAFFLASVENLLRIYFMQHWYNLTDPAMEEALYDSRAMREFAGIDLGNEPAPYETTILKFRHLMEARDFGAELLRLVNVCLAENGLAVSRGTIVDVTIINARPRPRIRTSSAIPTCTRPRRATSGTLA